MALDAITAYLKHWVLKMDKGDSLQFLSIGDGDCQGKDGNSSDDEDLLRMESIMSSSAASIQLSTRN